MARTKSFLTHWLSRTGKSIFDFLSKCEERGLFPKASRSIKRSVLGVVITGISALSASSMLNCILHCYAPIEQEPIVENTIAEPNPTAGADSVKISAWTYISAAPKDYYVARAITILNDDTTEMKPVDGEFDSQDEEVTTTIYVGNLDTGTVKVYVRAVNNEDDWDYSEEEIDLQITEEN